MNKYNHKRQCKICISHMVQPALSGTQDTFLWHCVPFPFPSGLSCGRVSAVIAIELRLKEFVKNLPCFSFLCQDTETKDATVTVGVLQDRAYTLLEKKSQNTLWKPWPDQDRWPGHSQTSWPLMESALGTAIKDLPLPVFFIVFSYCCCYI